MEQDSENESLYVDSDTIWKDLEDTFSFKIDEIIHIIKKWAEESYNIIDVTPKNYFLFAFHRWKRLKI
jgi:hypothetical protein